ncbi:uncharacterized protein LOC112514663 [Cynara cardunculus var. scolymus]|uniref:ZCF37 n=1 Tax=Cynara cardunculus var. scolymus TaxID=59895 RepID=A0A103XZ29_CYNCS|nr:uncharacterized protein LOC112514663 [Cynara cardunculus var. scolymus]KVH99465.1 hypothetical protein Ccrd_022301 [Cynara cardunculus var. scolymus]
MAFICGSSGNQEDDFEVLWPSQRKTTRRHSFCSRSNKDSKNPYSNRGLDKFEALLADLDGKRQKIFTQKGSEDISFVRFVYSNSNDVKPIVVKIKDQRKQDQKLKAENPKTAELSPPHPPNSNKTGGGTRVEGAKPSIDLCKKKDQWRRKVGDWWKPWFCLPLFVILILVFLVFFGRSFAILCTSLGWYLVPATSEINPKRQKKMVKKEYARKSSEKMIISPRSILNSEPMNNQPHRKSF